MAQSASIEKIVYGGWGLAHFEGSALFIPCTAPGDVVEFTVTDRKKKVLFARTDRIVRGSPMRRETGCPVFEECGGCHFLHLGYEDELEIKRGTVRENLDRIGGIRMELPAVTPSPDRFGYRNHAVVRADGERRCGFTRRGSSAVVPFPPGGCPLLPSAMREAIVRLPESSIPAGGEIRARLDAFGAVHLWGLADRGGPPDLLMEAGGYRFPVHPSSFFQVNRLLNDRLVETVLSLPRTRRRLLDLYCGCGFFTLPMMRRVTEAVGIERDPALVRGATAAARLNGVRGVRFRKGRVEDEIGRQGDFDLVLADPPRSGIPERALRGILRLRPAEIVLVSCEPPTFARDARRLAEAGYEPKRIELLDLFPATYHVEIAALFGRG